MKVIKVRIRQNRKKMNNNKIIKIKQKVEKILILAAIYKNLRLNNKIAPKKFLCKIN